jgi:phosphate transport system substrate-binding protein
MGLTSFITIDVGQRIILKSGLDPATFPPRKILVRKQINNDKK